MGMFSFIGNLFNGSQGAGYQGQNTNIQQPVTVGDAQGAMGNVSSGLGQQQNFANAVAAQNGLGNLSSVYNQYQGIANGTGPNPAQTMLNNQTGNNISQQAALMAGQRGSSANAGLMARQNAMVGAANQQSAVGTAANMQANQSLNALSGMGNIAGSQVGAQQNAITGYNTAAQNAMNQYLTSIGNVNAANTTMQSNINDVNAGIAQGNQAFQAGVFNNGMNTLSGTTAMQSLGGSGAGMLAMMADGGTVPQMQTPQPTLSAGISFLSGVYDAPGSVAGASPGSPGENPGAGAIFTGMSGQDKPKTAPTTPQPNPLEPSQDNQIQSAGLGDAPPPASSGVPQNGSIADLAPTLAYKGGPINGKGGIPQVPGHANVPGDSVRNDTVPALLSPGEIVVPRSHAMDPQKAAAFAYSVAMRNQRK